MLSQNAALQLLLLLATLATAAPNCPPLGPVFEKPRNFRSSAAIRAALANLTEAFQTRDADNSAAVRANITSYSHEVFSISDVDPVIFSWHRTAPAHASSHITNGGVKKTDADTVYRLGSLTKIFTVYMWLAQDGDVRWNEPITKYVPELAEAADKAKDDPVGNVAWGEVTVGSLAGQLSGAVRDYGLMGELTQTVDQNTAIQLGFPALNSSDPTLPKCGNSSPASSKSTPPTPPSPPPPTPNTGFQIPAYALEFIKGRPFQQLMEESIFRPLNLSHTFYNKAPSNLGIVPGPASASDAQWDYQLGDENPAGNMYSSIQDISVLGRSIMRSTLLAPVLTNRWLKPASLTSEPNAGVGYPWGIRRIVLSSVANGKRVVDAYNKAGRIGHYNSLLNLLPDYGVGFSVLLASPNLPANANVNLADALDEQLLPALEEAAREHAQDTYGGEYSNGENSSLKITTQPDRPGLGIENWMSNWTDMQYISVVLAAGYSAVSPSIKLYPTGLDTVVPGEMNRDTGRAATRGKRVAYKAVFEDLNVPSRTPPSMFSTDCGSWVSLTGVTYGSMPLDQFFFEVDGSGRVFSVENAALRMFMRKS
ncbi:beta-lactamase/transpeptidase-like protein [Pseudoneurospora amorphoporcata]|uniref:Beta-lactamase/transpeptidase-like protein n=1 Tax=Pseudoneurospora amorphoporcata TaxID=241081 RepID=A0AAN6NN91_9PEZI|nr:beta-lactamase/transpeptidase-like protein [Pseudoneurospora amorphoporcata]